MMPRCGCQGRLCRVQFLRVFLPQAAHTEGTSWNIMEFKIANEYTADIDTTELTDGKHTIKIEAKDSAGKTETETISIHIQNEQPSTEKPSSTPGFESLILISAISLIVFYLSFKSKRKWS